MKLELRKVSATVLLGGGPKVQFEEEGVEIEIPGCAITIELDVQLPSGEGSVESLRRACRGVGVKVNFNDISIDGSGVVYLLSEQDVEQNPPLTGPGLRSYGEHVVGQLRRKLGSS